MQTQAWESVRTAIGGARAKAAAGFASLDADARKLFEQLVARGRTQQTEIAERLAKLTESNEVLKQVRPGVDEAFRHLNASEYKALADQLSKTVRALQTRAIGALDVASREQARTLANELRRLAERLELLARKQDAAAAPEAAAVEPVVTTPVAHA